MANYYTTLWTTGVTVLLVLTVTTAFAFQPSAKGGHHWWPLFTTKASSSLEPPTLPANVVKYSQVPKEGTKFTADKIPKGLLKDHTTKAGTWGLIRVSQGTLEYTIMEPQVLVQTLVAPATGVIEPQRLHHVKALTDDVEFVVEFYRLPGTGPVDEKREGL
eukprot:scaffold11716_cov165-Amphora_coffeaeformis.AAC.5